RERPSQFSEVRTHDRVVPSGGHSRIPLGPCGGERVLRGFLRSASSEEVAPRVVCHLQRFIDAGRSNVLVWNRIRDVKCLPERQAEGTAQRELGDREAVASGAQVVLFGAKL